MFNFVILPSCTIPDFESETELIRFTFHADGESFPVADASQGHVLIREYMRDGIMSWLEIERAYYVKQARVLHGDLHVDYAYGLIWKRVN